MLFFWRKEIHTKAVHKMLVKLTSGGNGWTDELLDADGGVDVAAGVVGVAAGNSSSTEEESNSEKDEEIFFSRPTSLEVSVVEEPW